MFKRLSAPKAKIELRLDEAVYDCKDKLSGRLILDPQEEISVDELRLEFEASKKVKWKKGFSSFSTSSSLGTRRIPVGSSISLQKGQHYEQPFQIDIPFYSRSDPFTEIEVKVKGVVAVQGRPDLTNEVKPGIIFPYVIECLRQYGGCGFTTQPSPEPVRSCPQCGRNLEEIYDRKYSEEMRRSSQRRMSSGQRF